MPSSLQIRPPAHPEHSIHSPPILLRPSTLPPPSHSMILSLPPLGQFFSLPYHFVLSNPCIVSYQTLPTIYHSFRILSDGEIAASQKSFLSSAMPFLLTSYESQ